MRTSLGNKDHNRFQTFWTPCIRIMLLLFEIITIPNTVINFKKFKTIFFVSYAINIIKNPYTSYENILKILNLEAIKLLNNEISDSFLLNLFL